MSVTRRTFLTIVASGAMAQPALSIDSAQLRLAHTYPEDSPVNRALGRVTELTEWIVSLEIFPEGKLGHGAELIDQLYKGSLHFGLMPASVLSYLGTVFETLALPALFKDYDHWQRFAGSEAEKTVAELLAQNGLGLIGTTWVGSDHFITRTSIGDPAGLKGLRVSVPNLLGAAAKGYEELGISFVLLPPAEAYAAMERQIVDGLVASVPSSEMGKIGSDYSFQQVPLGGTVAWLIHASLGTFEFEIGDKEFEIARAVMVEMLDAAAAETHEMELNSIGAAGGMHVMAFDPEDWNAVRERMLAAMQAALPPEGIDIVRLIREIEPPA